MASLFRARRPAPEGGSGGKILRGRRAPLPSSPYARPSSAPPGSPRWFLGLVSGAGKLISSVFRSDGASSSTPSSSSSDSSSDEDHSPRSNGQEDIDAPKELHGLNQGLKKPELTTDCMEESHAIVRISETKLTIEKLLRQETFSRDECDRLTKLIQSRVVESPSSELVQDGVGSEIMNRGTGNNVDSAGDWQFLKQDMELPKSVHYSPNNLSSLSPMTPAFRACTPDIRSAAVMEAKKWLEEKKMPSNSKVDPVCGPCNSNTVMIHYDIHDKVMSPVDLAKSYMRSLPPWQSPSFSSSSLTTPMSSRVDFGRDDGTRATNTHSFPPFKDFKRKYLSARLWESPDDNRRVRLKLAENMVDSHGFKQIDSPKIIIQNGTSKVLLAADEKGQDVLGTKHCSSSLQALEISSAPAKSSMELLVEDQCSKDTLNLPNEKTVKPSPLTLTDKPASIIVASEIKEALKAVESANGTALPDIGSSDPTESKIESEPELPLAFDEEKDVIEPSQTEQEGIVVGDIPCEHLISASMPVEHGEPMYEKVVAIPEGIKSTILSDAGDVTNLDNNVQTSSPNTTPMVVISEANNSAGLNLDSDAKAQDGYLYSQHGANGLANEFSTDGGAAESNANSQSFCKEDQSSTHLSNGEQTIGISEETCELPGEPAIDTQVVRGMTSTAGKSENGTTMKSIERVLIEPQTSPSSHRKRAAVVKRRRVRGRGRGRGAK